MSTGLVQLACPPRSQGTGMHIWLSQGHVFHATSWAWWKHIKPKWKSQLFGSGVSHGSREAANKCVLEPQFKEAKLALSCDLEGMKTLGTHWESHPIGPSLFSQKIALGASSSCMGRPQTLFLIRVLASRGLGLMGAVPSCMCSIAQRSRAPCDCSYGSTSTSFSMPHSLPNHWAGNLMI